MEQTLQVVVVAALGALERKVLKGEVMVGVAEWLVWIRQEVSLGWNVRTLLFTGRRTFRHGYIIIAIHWSLFNSRRGTLGHGNIVGI